MSSITIYERQDSESPWEMPEMALNTCAREGKSAEYIVFGNISLNSSMAAKYWAISCGMPIRSQAREMKVRGGESKALDLSKARINNGEPSCHAASIAFLMTNIASSVPARASPPRCEGLKR